MRQRDREHDRDEMDEREDDTRHMGHEGDDMMRGAPGQGGRSHPEPGSARGSGSGEGPRHGNPGNRKKK